MHLVTALTLANRHAPYIVGSGALAQLLPPECLAQCLEQTGLTTIRRRRVSLESLVMLLIGMALYRKMDVWSIAASMLLSLANRAISRLT